MPTEYHEVSDVKVDNAQFLICIDGVKRVYPLGSLSEKLRAASPEQRDNFEVSPSGYGIHWPLLDEDISIDGLLKVKHTPLNEKSELHSVL